MNFNRRNFLKGGSIAAALQCMAVVAAASGSGTYVPNEGDIPVAVWQTTGNKPFREIRTTPFTVHAYTDKAALDVDAAQSDHEFLGLGVSMTDASCWLLSQMTPEKRRALLEAVFSPEKGAGLSAVRLNIGSSDYSTALYTYNDVDGDVEMKNFSVKRDDIYLFRMVKEAKSVNPSMFLFAAPWSPPGWMKDTGRIVDGKFKDGCELALANYLCAYAKACRDRGLSLGAVNIQNEAHFSTGGSYPSCVLTGEQESRVAKVFARRLKEEGLDTKVWIWDHNYWGATNRVLRQLEDAELRDAIGGVAWHSYRPPATPIRELHRKYPDVPFYHTEMGPSITTDERTEFWWCDRVFDALENGCRMFTGWNLCLTDDGQPLVGPHGCAGLVTVDPDTGDFIASAQYRVFRHIGPFVKRGARLMHVSGECDGTRIILFRNPTGEYVLVIGCTGKSVLNKKTPRARVHVKYRNEWLAVPLPYGTWSLTTVVFGGGR